MFKAFLVKYAEIGIKGKNRYLFEDALIRQMEYVLKPVEGTFHVTKEQGRIYVLTEGDFDYEEALEALKRVFSHFQPYMIGRLQESDRFFKYSHLYQ